MKIFLYIIGSIFGLILLLALGFGLMGYDLFTFSFFAPKYAAVQRQVYENTPSYLLGKEQEIAKDRQEYMTTTDQASKVAITSVLREDMAGVPREQLSLEAQSFLSSIGI